MSFKRLGLELPLLEGVEVMGYNEPTPIQRKAIPQALAGRDIIGCAQTGTGKTAAFVLPTLQRMSRKPGIKALIVTPTRELAIQIEEVATACAAHTQQKIVAVYGGVPYAPQGRKVKRGVDMLVATPGRLLDMMRRGDVSLSDIEVFVLDEADRMLDMGFLPDIKRIFRALPEKRQNLLFSATISPRVLDAVGDTLDKPVSIEVGPRSTPVEAIEQVVYPVNSMQKADLLIEIIKRQKLSRVLVFTRTKRKADFLFRVLSRRGVGVATIHSDRSQSQRQSALEGFKTGRFDVLVATDIVARGIDVEGISHVVNFDIPSNPEDYVHRVGRTARASARGTAVSFLSAEEVGDLRDIEAFIGKTLKHKDLSGFEYMARYTPSPTRTAQVATRLVYDGGAKRSMKRRTKRR